MSQAGYCPKRLAAILAGARVGPSPVWLQRAAEEGNWHETRIKDELRALGCEIKDEQKELCLEFPTFQLVGHIEGLIKVSPKVWQESAYIVQFWNCSERDVEGWHHLEVKSFSLSEHQRWLTGTFEAFPAYAVQRSCYLAAIPDDLSVYVAKDRNNGARHLYFIKGETVPIEEIAFKLSTVIATPSVEASYNPTSIECRRCELRTTSCSPAPIDVTDADIADAVTDYQVGRAQEREGKALADAAKDALVAYAKQHEVLQYQSLGRTVHYSSYPRETLSIKRLEEIVPRSEFEPAINVSMIERIRIVDPEKEDSVD
jgi:hypothetical protein